MLYFLLRLTSRPLVSAVGVQQHCDRHPHVLGATGHQHVLTQRLYAYDKQDSEDIRIYSQSAAIICSV